MDFGATIRRARESRGITTSQLAAQTRILVQTIEDMEQNKFKRIPAPIYGRGFVKLICECLDLDPVTMVPAFMSAYNGEPQIDDEPVPAGGGIRYAQPFEAPAQQPQGNAPEQGSLFDTVPPEPAAPAASAEEPVSEPAPAEPVSEGTSAQPEATEAPIPEPPKAAFDSSLQGLELFDPSVAIQKEAPVSEPPAQPAPEDTLARFSEPASNDGFSRFKQPAAEDDFSRFATPLPEDETPKLSPLEKFRAGFSSVSSGVIGHVRQVRRPAFRMSVLAAGAILVLVLCIWGIVALFRATSSNDGEQAETPSTGIAKSEAAPKPAKTETAAQAKKSAEESVSEEATGPIRATVPLKLPGFYID